MTRLGLCGHAVTGIARYCPACARERKRASDNQAGKRWRADDLPAGVIERRLAALEAKAKRLKPGWRAA